MDIERIIGADIMMAFDECPPGDSDYAYAKKSLGLTHRWLDRCIQRFNETELNMVIASLFFLSCKDVYTPTCVNNLQNT